MVDEMKLYNQDCLPAMKEMPDNAFSLAIVDPPYGVGDFTQSDRKYTVSWNETTPNNDYFSELLRVSKEQIIWGANYYNCFSKGGGAIIWDKHNPHPSMSRCEMASYSGQKKVDYVSIQWFGFACKNRDGFHPCEKPVALYKWLLKNYAKPGQTILDTHLGSGSIAIACDVFGFDLTAFEIDLEYIEGATDRLIRHRAQGVLDL